MTDHENARRLDELDRLLNDPDVPMDPSRVWSLLAELSRHEVPATPRGDGAGMTIAAQTAGSAD